MKKMIASIVLAGIASSAHAGGWGFDNFDMNPNMNWGNNQSWGNGPGNGFNMGNGGPAWGGSPSWGGNTMPWNNGWNNGSMPLF